MQPQEFLAAVLPSAGYYCAVELSTNKKQHVWVDATEGVWAAVSQFDDSGLNSYFALASFREPTQRTADNALYVRALAIDIDCGDGKPYKTQRHGLRALLAFLDQTELPQPAVVSSGYGLHVYWPLNADVPVSEWRVVGERMKRLCTRHNLSIDPVIGANAAQVLRVPGTRNWKKDTPVDVQVLVWPDAAPYALEPIATYLKETVNGHDLLATPVQLEGKPLTGSGLTLIQNSTYHFKKLWNRTLEGKGCKQLEWYWLNANKTATEGVWRPLLSIAKHCVDGVSAMQRLTAMHPRPHSEVESKWAKEEGPWGCDKFDANNPGVCGQCQYKGKVTNPLALARELLVDNQEKEVVVPITPTPAATQINYRRPLPPKGFSFGKNGGVYAKVQGKTDEESYDAEVLPYDLFVNEIFAQEEGGRVQLVANRPDRTKVFLVSSEVFSSKDKTLSALANEAILPTDPKSGALLYTYLHKAVADFVFNKGDRNAPEAYGWQKRSGGFVLGQLEYMPDGTIKPAPNPALQNLNGITQPFGSLDTWKKIVKVFIDKQEYNVLLGFCVALGAPLMRLSGHNFLLINMSSHQSGSNKSNTLRLAASVYGHPEQYWVHPETSAGTAQVRMSMLGNLPIVIDELTTKLRNKAESTRWIEDFLMSGSLGKGKERQQQRGGVEQTQHGGWQTLALFSSNMSFNEALLARRLKTSAENMRMLEIDMHKTATFSLDEQTLLAELKNNYGHAGVKYINWLVQNQDVARKKVDEINRALFLTCKMDSQERFWQAGIACMLAGATLFGKGYADVMDLPLAKLAEKAQRLILDTRAYLSGNETTTTDVFSAYMENNYGRMVVVKKESNQLRLSLGVDEVRDESLARADVAGRIEHGYTPGVVSVFIPLSNFRMHCHMMGYNSRSFKKEMSGYIVQEVRKHLFADTRVTSPATRCMQVDIPESEWKLTAPIAQSATLP